MNASIAQHYYAHYKNDGCAPVEHQLKPFYTTPAATLYRFGALALAGHHEQAVCPTELDLGLGQTLARQPLRGQQSYSTTQPTERSSWTPIIPPSIQPSPWLIRRGITLTSDYDEMLARRRALDIDIETDGPTTYAARSACSMPPTPAAPSPYLSPAPAEAC